ncbi:MAG: thiamine pyrophosphate-binding protein [Pseudomonadota bacterium]
MSGKPIYRTLADAFAEEGTDTQFILMGDGNMHFAIALDAHAGMQSVHVRHEHCAVAAATAYAIATNRVGIASVTCGPGLTQITTALPAAVRAQVPLVVFAGESPMHARFYNQLIDQAPIVTATGARYIAAHSATRMLDHVREAFLIARHDRVPVVLGVPYDLQKQPEHSDDDYEPSTSLLADGGRAQPDPRRLGELADWLMSAEAPVLIGGRGALRSGAADSIRRLADATGAMLATTLPVRGLFHDHRFSLGVAGGYASDVARETFAAADLVVAIGASLTYYTKDGGNLFPNAAVVQLDTAPRGLKDGMQAANLFVTADAKAGAEAAVAEIERRVAAGERPAAKIRSDDLAGRLQTEPADGAAFDIAAGEVDPRSVIAAIDRTVPKDWDIVTGSGHQAYYNSQMRGRPADRFLTVREFGAIGNGLSYALGVAAARQQGDKSRIVLIEGDGGFMMHVQELETLKRLGYRVLICVLNDAAYGSEIHKLQADGIDDSLARFGETPIAEIARGFGVRGADVTNVAQIPDLFRAFNAQGDSEVWNIRISDRVTAPTMRKTIARGHGNM